MPLHLRTTRILLAAAACAALLCGCRSKGIEELIGTELFSLSMGKLEDQIDLFQLENAMAPRYNGVFMREGWFYVANGNAGKIMVFSSYGDLIFLLYNPKTNPPPTILGAPGAEEQAAGAATVGSGQDAAAGNDSGREADAQAEIASTRGAVEYPFTDIGRIAVASDRTLYVDDAVVDAKVLKDEVTGVARSRVVLRFDRKGRQLGFLGEEGIGGSPFPYIIGLYVTSGDQPVVICRTPQGWEVFWYSRDGQPLYVVEIDNDNLPVPAKKGSRSEIVSIVPDLQNPVIHVVVYTYKSDTDSTEDPVAQDTVDARAYSFDLRKQAYDPAAIEFPTHPSHKEKLGLKTKEIPSPPSDLLGVSSSGYYYLLAYTDTNLYTLQILDRTGTLRAQRRLVIEDTALSFRDIHLSSTGILYGMLADQVQAHFSWWRSDLLLKGD
jgi:hypothetical protein